MRAAEHHAYIMYVKEIHWDSVDGVSHSSI